MTQIADTKKDTPTNGVKKVRTPKNGDSITKGALALSLNDRARLCQVLKTSITAEVGELKSKTEQAAKIAEGL